VEVAAMHTYADELLAQLSAAYGEFWETWLVPTAIGAGVWCARLHADHKHYINAESPAMLGTLMDRDDQLARRVYSPAVAAARDAIKPARRPTETPLTTSAATNATTETRRTDARGDVA